MASKMYYDCTDKTPDEYYANPNDPSYFFTCVGGTPIILQCPANLIYYEDREKCDHTSTSEEDDSSTSIIEVGGSTLSTTDGVVDWSTTIVSTTESEDWSTTIVGGSSLSTTDGEDWSTTSWLNMGTVFAGGGSTLANIDDRSTKVGGSTLSSTDRENSTTLAGDLTISTTDIGDRSTTKDKIMIDLFRKSLGSTVTTENCHHRSPTAEASVHCKTETPNVVNIPLTSKPDSITFSTSANNRLEEDGPFSVVAILSVLQGNTLLETINGDVLPSTSDIVDIDFYDKFQKKTSVNCEIKFPVIKNVTTQNSTTSVNKIPVCHFTPDNDASAMWSTAGCETIYDDDFLVSGVTCNCNHLTSFVILMKPKQIEENMILSVLTNFGVAISSVFLIITLIIIYGFKTLRNSDRYRSMRHLVIALLSSNFFFSCLKIDVNNIPIACSFLAGCLHFSFLAAFSWMLIISTDIYMKIKYPFADHEKRFMYSRYCGWIVPLIAVGVTVGITRENYASDKCWLDTHSGAIWAFIFPVCLTLLIVFMQLVVVSFVALKKSQLPNQTEDEMQKLKRIRNLFGGILLLTPVVGLSWIFGVIIIFDNSEIMEHIFVILNSTQGLLIWLTQCVFSKEVRQTFRKRLSNRIGQNSSINTINNDTISTSITPVA
ncbi:adhesion G protein-coupled receptor L3-like [Anneissia japonica]|uniref:adhesion G protein-coupled receptor L3-like n=1 Tax=Anneissia japonica TaxID=1529436 RepID=UPI001425B5B0|nr:adhesion G protein-coupled receptor L3-like [Anneissia japonica]